MLRVFSEFKSKKIVSLSTAFLLLSTLTLSGCSDDGAAEFHAEGQKLMEEGNPNGAIVFFKNALEEEPNNFELRHDLVRAYIQSGKRTQAEAELAKCLVQQPNNVELLFTATHFYTNPVDGLQALKYLEQIEKLQDPTAETRELVATNLRMLGRITEAEQVYKEALALDPTNRNSEINLASLYLSQEREKEALEFLNNALTRDPGDINALQLRALYYEDIQNYSASEADYKKIVSALPNDAYALYALAGIYLKQTKVEDAEKIHSQMSSMFPQNMYTSLLGGKLAFQAGDFTEASKLLQQSVQVSPSVDGLYFLASSLHNTGSSESALSHLRRILDVQPTNGAAMMLTAQILHDQGRYQEAEYEIDRLIDLYPDRPEAYNLLGEIQKQLGKPDEALVSFEKALEIDNEYTPATMSRSNILIEQNQGDKAIAYLEESIKEDSENIAVRSALYEYYVKQNDYNKAMEVVNEGLKENPENMLFLTMKAGVYMARQENELAVNTLKKAHEIEPNFAPATELLLNIYMLENNNQAALELCDNFLKHSPEDVSFLVTSAVLLDNMGRVDEATARFEKANELNSERALISLVRRAQNEGDTVKAEKYLTDKLAAYPIPQVRSLLATYYVENDNLQKALDVYSAPEVEKTPEGLVGKFRLYMSDQQFAKALEEAELIIENYPSSPDGYVLKAFALENENKFDEAFNTLDVAYKTIQSPQLLLQLANLCLRDGRNDKALSYFRTILVSDPNNKDALSGQGYAFLQQKNYTDSIASYEKILELYPQDLANINNLASALAEEGNNTSRAVDLATQVYLDAPEVEAIADTYAFTLMANKQLNEAINVVENGLKSNPNSAILNYRYGLALLASDRTDEGVQALQKSVEIGNFGEIEQAKQLIIKNK